TAGTPSYHLELNNDGAGSMLATARSITTAAAEFEFVGPGDTKDIFRVDLPSTQRLGVQLENLNDPVSVRIGQDSNNDGNLDIREIKASKTISTASGALFLNGTKGRFFVDVSAAGAVGTNYKITFGTAPTDNAGDTLATAKSITSTATDFVGTG